ncbi:MAG TPA: acyltransferase [Rhizomicrobium sp.]
MSDTRASFDRVPSLDGLRAISILIVLLSHFVSSRIFPGGFGVLVFFVVSGFLITRLLYAEANSTGRIRLGNFYLRRFFRLYPVVTVYAACVVLFCMFTHVRIDWYEPLSALFYFANYLYALDPAVTRVGAGAMPFSIFWSLSVEEHFYFIFPVLFLILRRRPRTLITTLILVCALCLALRILLAAAYPQWLDTKIFYYTDLRLDSIVFGVLLAAVCETRQGRNLVTLLGHPLAVAGAALAIILSLIIRDPWFRETLRYSLQAGAVVVILAALVFSDRYRAVQTILNFSFVSWIGLLSYSLYVWHPLLPIILYRAVPGFPHKLEAPICLVASLAVAAISYYGLEKPAGALRHKFGSRTAGTQEFGKLRTTTGEKQA